MTVSPAVEEAAAGRGWRTRLRSCRRRARAASGSAAANNSAIGEFSGKPFHENKTIFI